MRNGREADAYFDEDHDGGFDGGGRGDFHRGGGDRESDGGRAW